PLPHSSRGFRDYMLFKTPDAAEFWLVLIWSFLGSVPAFVSMAVLRWWRLEVPVTIENVWLMIVKPSCFIVIVTSLAVVGWLLTYKDDQGRGVVAGLLLRMALFASLFTAAQVGASGVAVRGGGP